MNVLLSSFVHWWNAEAAYAAILGQALMEAGHGVWVLTTPGTRNEEELRRRGLTIVTEIPSATVSPWRWGQTVQALRAFQARERIDVVNVFRSQEFPLHVLAARGSDGPALVRTRGTDRPIRGGRLSTWLHRRGSVAHIASSNIVRERMTTAFGLAPERIKVVYYPAEPSPAGNSPRPADIKKNFLKALGFSRDRMLLGIVGRLYPEKGHRFLLEAINILRMSHPEVLLVILAKNAPGEDPERPALEAMVIEKGLTDHVRFLNFREDVRELMKGMDIGVVPSISSEVNCRVVMEFFSGGTPVVAFPTGALPEVITDGETGLVTEDFSPEKLAAALKKLVEDHALRKSMGKAASGSAKGRFSGQRFLAETLAVYESAMAAKHSGS